MFKLILSKMFNKYSGKDKESDTKPNEKQTNDDFDTRLKYVVPFEECKVDIEVPTIVEHKEQTVEELSDIWRDIDSNGLRMNCFLSAQKKLKLKDLSEILYAIFKLRFLVPISHLRVDYQSLIRGKANTLFGKILITDDKSHAYLEDIIDLNYLKKEPIAISAQFNIRDELPANLSKNYHLIYLISLSEMIEQDFEAMVKRLSQKRSCSQSVFEFFIFSDSDQNRVKRLLDLSQTSKISGVQQLGAFLPIDHNLILLHSTVNMNWLTNTDQTKLDIELIERMAKLLTNFLEQIGEFPKVFRYYKSFSDINKLIAERTYKMMTDIANQRRMCNESRHESNYELLVIDRSVDVITPLTHCHQFRAFVYNELEKEYKNDVNDTYRRLATIPVDQTLMIRQTLTEVSISQAEANDEVLAKKLNQNITNARKVFNKIRNKSYLELLDIEKSLLETKSGLKNNKNFVKTIGRLVSQSDKEVTNSDLKRLLIISRLFDDNIKANDAIDKEIVTNRKERHLDLTVVHDFVHFTKKFVSKDTYSSDEPIISNIVKQYLSDTLPYDRFPESHRSKSSSQKAGHKRRLILFVLGGISYNDLTAVSQFDSNVIFCSNALITPNMLINSIVYQ